MFTDCHRKIKIKGRRGTDLPLKEAEQSYKKVKRCKKIRMRVGDKPVMSKYYQISQAISFDGSTDRSNFRHEIFYNTHIIF